MMAEELAKKRTKIRGGHRAHVKRVLDDVGTTLENYDQTRKQKLLQLKITLNEKLETLKNLDEQILESCKDDDIEAEILEEGSFREQVHECLIKIDEVLLVTVQETPPTSTQDNASESHSSHNSSFSEPKIKAKLRKLSMKKFNGNPLHWQSWWDCFNSAVHSNDSLMQIDKYIYMKHLLEGQAAACISGLQLTESNYAEAVETLKQRFGVHQVIINAHMDS